MESQGGQRYILYYSKRCPHSNNFRQMLVKKPDLEAKFLELCVDSGGKLPRYVDAVPFLVVHDEKGRQLHLKDGEAFNWLRQEIASHSGDFEAYDSACVLSSTLSDNFAFVGSEDGPGLSHNFEWLPGHQAENGGTMPDGMYTPNQATYGGEQQASAIPKSALDKYIEQRNMEVPLAQRGASGPGRAPPEIDFTQPLPKYSDRYAHEAPPKRQPTQYEPKLRNRQVRMVAPQRGIDFTNPGFEAGLTQKQLQLQRTRGTRPPPQQRLQGIKVPPAQRQRQHVQARRPSVAQFQGRRVPAQQSQAGPRAPGRRVPAQQSQAGPRAPGRRAPQLQGRKAPQLQGRKATQQQRPRASWR